MRKFYIAGILLCLIAVGAWLWSRTPVPVNAAIGGEVTWVAEPGTEVSEGSELVRISALSGGEIAAARSKYNGVVREACVKKGDAIASGAVVVRIEKR